MHTLRVVHGVRGILTRVLKWRPFYRAQHVPVIIRRALFSVGKQTRPKRETPAAAADGFRSENIE